ncbi:MAG: hypothetical protein FWC32_09520 [Firmicutes bacterium]|nr:hypothetical protein [Bacillota bacterium]
MKNQNEMSLGDIRGFSKTAHKILGVAIVTYAVVIVQTVIAEIMLF